MRPRSDDLTKMVMLRRKIGAGSGSAHACSALAQDPKLSEARGQLFPLAQILII